MADISVSYERKFSDGNYGFEGMSLSATIADELDIAHRLRTTVLSFLAASRASRVSYAARLELNGPQPAGQRIPVAVTSGPPPDDLEDLPF